MSKNPRTPTLEQKKIMTKNGLDWKDFLVITMTKDNLKVIRKSDNKVVDLRR